MKQRWWWSKRLGYIRSANSNIFLPPPLAKMTSTFAKSHVPLRSRLPQRVYFGFNVDFLIPPTSLNLKSSARLPYCLRYIYTDTTVDLYVYCNHVRHIIHIYLRYLDSIAQHTHTQLYMDIIADALLYIIV